MADLHLILDLDPATMQALDKLATETGVGSRCSAAKSILRNWLIATGYLDEDKPFEFETAPEDGSA